MRNTIAILAMSYLWVFGPAFAQTNMQTDRAENPLSMFIGEWHVTEDIAEGMMGPARTGFGVATGQWGPSENSVIISYESTGGPMKGFKLTEIISRETDENAFSLVWVDRFNVGIGMKTGIWLENNSFRFEEKQSGDSSEKSSMSLIQSIDNGFSIITFNEVPGENPHRVMTLNFSNTEENMQ